MIKVGDCREYNDERERELPQLLQVAYIWLFKRRIKEKGLAIARPFNFGVADRIRTDDIQNHNLTL